MHLALWDIPPVDFLDAVLKAEAVSVPLEIERKDAQTCTELLLQELVDVALLPSLVVLSNTEVFDVLPGVALSTWKYPYARLVLRGGMESVETVAYARQDTQEALVARIILREHYDKNPTFVPLDAVTPEGLLHAEQDASLVVGPNAPLLQTPHMALNLGQEWFELANYPMVWGLFATLKDAAAPVMVEMLLRTARVAEQQRPMWVQAQEMPPLLHTFYSEHLRLRLDDLAMASLTQFRDYLYYYNVTDEIPELPLYELPEDWEDDEEPGPFL